MLTRIFSLHEHQDFLSDCVSVVRVSETKHFCHTYQSC